MSTEIQNDNNANRFAAASDDDLAKLRRAKLIPPGWYPMVVQGAKMRDAASGKWGINVTYSPAEAMEANAKIKKSIRVYNTLWMWFRDPGKPERKKADNVYGMFESFVRSHGITMPSDGSEPPKRAYRDNATDKLCAPDGTELKGPEGKKIADQLTAAYDKWMDKLVKELIVTVEKGAENPLVGYAAFAKIKHEKSEDGRIFMNVERFAATLPDDAEMTNVFELKSEDDEEEDSEGDDN